MAHPFQLVDVFGSGPFTGNPLAVVADADGLSTEAMQAMTRWFNLSETAFLLKPTDPAADYRVRIFTLTRELPFAGHPTLGSCHAWLSLGGRAAHDGSIVQECGVGLIAVRNTDGRLAFAAPQLIRGGKPSEAELTEAATFLRIGRKAIIDAAWIDNGPGWLGIMLQSAEAVLAVDPERSHPREIDIGLVGAYPPGQQAAYELRALFTDAHNSIVEDPVTGSLNASVGQWLFDTGRATGPYIASQGTRLGRRGRVHVEKDAEGQVWIGGLTQTLISGTQTVVS